MIRTLCLGFDGATPQLLFPWMEEGLLPNLASLRSSASWGPLRSTFPPMTLPAWSSFLTGRGPGEHGIFDFTRREPGSGRLVIVDSTDRAVPTLPRLITHNLWDDLETHINKFFEDNTLNDILFKEVRSKSEELKQ